jgi:hypothetical protein
MQVITRLTARATLRETTDLQAGTSKRTMLGGGLPMPAEAKCPRCQITIRVPSHFDGQRVKCPQCQERFVVTLPPPQTPPSRAEIFEGLQPDSLLGKDNDANNA